jgi:two-component system phosphate regulon sensor histidine kinase PhoR
MRVEQEMSVNNLDKLASLITQEHNALLTRWREQVRQLPCARHLDTPTLNDHIPGLINELAAALKARSDETISEALCEGTPPVHGAQRAQDGFDIEEVVAEYNILRGCIHDLADTNGLNLQGKPFHIINRVLDEAIGLAVQTYATLRAMEVQQRREEYLSFVAHDLRTPLNAIALAGRVLERTSEAQSAGTVTSQMLKTLRRNVQHLETLVAKVLEENTNLQTEIGIKLERREFDLWPLVEALIHDLHPVAGTSSTQLINGVPDDLIVYADAGLLKRVFQNLIANAINYTPRGEVIIGAKEITDEERVEVWVSDDGEGIPAERIENVFDILETDPLKEGGSGLGLAIVKTFIEAHGGEVTVKSKEGVGTEFRFSLPFRTSSPLGASQ